MMEERLLTQKEVAALYNVKVATVREWTRNGTLKPIYLGAGAEREQGKGNRTIRYKKDQLPGFRIEEEQEASRLNNE